MGTSLRVGVESPFSLYNTYLTHSNTSTKQLVFQQIEGEMGHPAKRSEPCKGESSNISLRTTKYLTWGEREVFQATLD